VTPTNDELIKRIKEKLNTKNQKIKQQQEEITLMKKLIKELQVKLEESVKKVENRENLLTTIDEILQADET